MENKEEESNFFDFLPQNSVIKFKKFKFNYKDLKISDASFKKGKYLYDTYTNQFIYFVNGCVCIFNIKGKFQVKVKYTRNEKIRYCTCEKKNRYILIITDKNKLLLIGLKDLILSEYNNHDYKTGSRLGYMHGAFFIARVGKNKDEKKKEGEEFYIGIISNNSYRIVSVSLSISEKCFVFKNSYISEIIPITEFYFNNIFNVLIIRNEYQGFYLINLKNSYCFNTMIEISINNVYFTSKFFLQNIYNKLYFIHFTENQIELYRLNNLKKKKEPKKIFFNKSGKTIDYEFTQLQFYNNLIILYMGDNIRIYDIKAGQKKKFGKVDIPQKKIDGFFDKIKILGKCIDINNDLYKIKFLPEIFLTKDVSNIFEAFFNLLRRRNATNASTTILKNLIDNYELSTFFAIISKLIENYAKSKEENYIDDKKNMYEIIYIGHNFFYLPQDEIFSLFNDDFNNIDNLKLLQVMITVYNEYEKKNIPIDHDVFISALFYQLSKTDDFSRLDFTIKNNSIPVNKKLGLYLIDRSRAITDKEKKELALDLGIEILLGENENIDDVLYELIEEEKYEESINIITDYYFGYSYKTDKKNIKEDINKHLRKFISGKLKNISKLRGQDSFIEEENVDF